MASAAPVHVRLDPDVADAFPGYRWGLVWAEGLENDEPAFAAAAAAALADATAAARERFVGRRPTDDEHVAAWRRAFSAFGTRPSDYPPSVEALLKRVLKGGEIPLVNPGVACFNAISLRHVAPVGADDADRTAGTVRLARAAGDEPFRPIGAEADDPPAAGEVVLRDDDGVLCRRWCWRQGARTAVAPASRRVLFNIPTLPPFEGLDGALSDLATLLAPWADRVVTATVDAERPEVAFG